MKGDSGFTLTELLVVLVLAGGIVAAALHLVVHLVAVNQQQMTRSRLQSDLQRSLNYMAADLEQAVYVYSGTCLGQGRGNGCPGLAHHLPTALTPAQGRYPMLAFWRRSPLSQTLQSRCRQGSLSGPVCQTQHSYTLVVYLVSTRNDGAIWQGQGRLQRYTLTKFRQSGAATPGYVDPSQFGHRFAAWPQYQGVGEAAPVDQQRERPSLRGSAPVPLMDFVAGAVATPPAACPPGHHPTAPAAALAQVDSLLGCLEAGDGPLAIALTLRGHLPAAIGATPPQLTLHRRAVPRTAITSPVGELLINQLP